jgi:hypothetical protein
MKDMSYIILGGHLASGVTVAIGPFPNMDTAQSHLDATQKRDDDLYTAALIPLDDPAEHLRQIEPKGDAA